MKKNKTNKKTKAQKVKQATLKAIKRAARKELSPRPTTPFRSKKEYRRKPKHSGRNDEE